MPARRSGLRRSCPRSARARELVPRGITIELGKRSGWPTIRGLRITVGDVLGWLAARMSPDEIVADLPELTEGDVRAALAYAADRERRSLTADE